MGTKELTLLSGYGFGLAVCEFAKPLLSNLHRFRMFVLQFGRILNYLLVLKIHFD